MFIRNSGPILCLGLDFWRKDGTKFFWSKLNSCWIGRMGGCLSRLGPGRPGTERQQELEE